MEGFAPIPRGRLPFPSLVVASRNDPFAAFERSWVLAEAWGSRFVDAGNSGHLNADAGFGPWPLGETLLAELMR
jgi:predicted alpha/beta hydrolase family esterase